MMGVWRRCSELEGETYLEFELTGEVFESAIVGVVGVVEDDEEFLAGIEFPADA